MRFLADWMLETWRLAEDAAPWLLLGFALAGATYVLLPTAKIVAHLGRPGFMGVIKAALVGVPLPLCSCSVIPVASSLRQRGASRGATASFLISTPESGLDSVAISYALLGPLLAIVRPLAAFLSAIVAGGLIVATEGAVGDASPALRKSDAGCCGDACCAAPQDSSSRSLIGRVGRALRYGFVEMFADLAHWLLLGFLLGGLIAALLPDALLEQAVGEGGAMLLMLLAGLPMYVCATAATPVAAALIAKGLSPGAALVFLLVGPATNIATMAVVARDLGRRSLILYLLSIAAVALLLGVIVNAIAHWLPVAVVFPAVGVHEPSWLAAPSAVILSLLVANGLRVRAAQHMKKRRADKVG